MTQGSVGEHGSHTVLLDHLDEVQLQVSGRAALVGADATDPGTLDWSATATLSIWSDEDDPDPGWASAPGVALSSTDTDGGRELVVLEARGLLVDLEWVGDVVDALDARSSDYEHFVPLFGDRGPFGLVELNGRLAGKLTGGGSQVVIIDQVLLAPAWRGLGGVGRLLIGLLLRWVCADPRVVAVQPFPTDLDEDARQIPVVFDPALERVCRVWASLGFEPFTDDIWIMDPHKIAHSQALASITQRLGL